MSRIVKVTDHLYKRLHAEEFFDDDGNIQSEVSINKAHQASSLATVAQEFADTTALESAAKLSLTSQLSSNVAGHSEDTSQAAITLATVTATANADAQTIATFKEAVDTFGETIANWPLYTTPTQPFSNIYRDEGFNDITLLYSGLETSQYYFHPIISGQIFFDLGTSYSGLNNLSILDSSRFLVNASENDAVKLKVGPDEPFSIESMLYYGTCDGTGYITDFGDNYKFKTLSGLTHELKLEVGGVTTTNGIELSLDDWQHVMVAYDPINRSVSYYKDGSFVLRDSTIGTPGAIPTNNKIGIFKGIVGAINSLKIYKAPLSSTTAKANYVTNASRYVDLDTGGTFIAGAAGGNQDLMVDPSTALFDGANQGRHIGGHVNTWATDTVVTTYSGIYNLGTFPSMYLHTLDDWNPLIMQSFIKMPGDTHLILSAHVDQPGPGSNDNADLEFFVIPATISSAAKSPATSIETVTGVTILDMFTMSLVLSGLQDRALYTAVARGRKTADSKVGIPCILRDWNIVASNSYYYNSTGPGKVALPAWDSYP